MHPVAVVEQEGRSAVAVDQQSLKSSIQAGEKRWIFLVEVDKIFWSIHLEAVPAFLEAACRLRVGKILAGKNKDDVALLAAQRDAVTERILDDCPSQVNPQRLIDPGSGLVERFVVNGLDHPEQLRLGLLTGQSGDETYDSWHMRFCDSDWKQMNKVGRHPGDGLRNRCRTVKSRTASRPRQVLPGSATDIQETSDNFAGRALEGGALARAASPITAESRPSLDRAGGGFSAPC